MPCSAGEFGFAAAHEGRHHGDVQAVPAVRAGSSETSSQVAPGVHPNIELRTRAA